jgi:predicted nuclease of predicted toxin-antitoxin system
MHMPSMKKILLDENLPRPLARLFSAPLEVISVHDIGWAEKKNGDLIRSMLEEGFEFLLTADKNLQNQQNLEKYPVRLIVLKTFDNRFKTLVSYVPLIQEVIVNADDTQIIEIDIRNLKVE